MTELLIGICVFLLANLYWIYKANQWCKAARFRRCPLSPYVLDAERNLNAAIGMFILASIVLAGVLIAQGGITNG